MTRDCYHALLTKRMRHDDGQEEGGLVCWVQQVVLARVVLHRQIKTHCVERKIAFGRGGDGKKQDQNATRRTSTDLVRVLLRVMTSLG